MEISFSDERNRVIIKRLIFEPTNLLAAILLQFARAVTEGYQLQTCAGCGEYFQVGKAAVERTPKPAARSVGNA